MNNIIKLDSKYYKNIFDSSPCMQIIFDRYSLIIIDANKKARSFFGSSDYSILKGKNIDNIFSENTELIINHLESVQKGNNENLLIQFKMCRDTLTFLVDINLEFQNIDTLVHLSFTDVTKLTRGVQVDNSGQICFVEGSENINNRQSELIGSSVFRVYDQYPDIFDSFKMGLSGQSIRMLVENTLDIMFVLDQNGVLTYISNSIKKFGYDVDEVIGKSVFDLIHEEDKDYTYEEVKKTFMGMEDSTPRTFRIMLKDGSYIIVEEVGTPVKDDGGKVTHITGILRNITERKLAEDELRKSEERYRQLVELMPESVIILQGQTIIFVNNTFLQLCKLEHEKEVIGKDLFEFIHPDYTDVSRNFEDNILIRKLKSISYESRIVTCDNKLVDVEITGSFFIYSGKPSIIYFIRDISERKRNKELIEKIKQNDLLLREAQEYDKLKTEFFSNISHEFKTPLSVILITLQLLNLLMKMNKNPNETTQKFEQYFYTMKQNCYRLIRLVNNLIDITKIDSNFYKIILQNNNIVDIVESIVLSITDYVENKGLSIQLIKEADVIVTACDPDKIERIMLNLISNAIKFTSSGGKITIKIKRKKDNVQISVIDTGIGIPPDKLEYIFERFRQIDKSLTRNHEGSGIGLSIVKSLLEMHGGSISVKSTFRKGSTFVVELPIRLISCDEDNFSKINGIINERIKEMQIERINIEFSDIYQ